jgi:hypothetical protein
MANQTEKIYETCIIYMLTINEECYIGSTFDFNQRMINHKSDCYNENGERYNFKIYKYIRGNGGWNNVNISIIDVYYLVNRKFKKETEQYYMEYFQSGLNSNKAFTGVEPGLNKHEYDKQYYEHNVEKFKQRRKQYYEANKQHEKEYNQKYYRNNVEKIKQRRKQYYEANKQHEKEYSNKRVNCSLCKKEINRGNLLRHIKNSCKKNLK